MLLSSSAESSQAQLGTGREDFGEKHLPCTGMAAGLLRTTGGVFGAL